MHLRSHHILSRSQLMDNKVILVSDKSVKGKILNIGAVGPGGDKAPGC